MATNLIVRKVDTEIAKLLKETAARHGRSAEAEHRAILEAALKRPRKRSFYEVLASMPNVGSDSDFQFNRD
jgi:antitoxin FitA